MSIWSERIVLQENKTVSTTQDELLFSLRSEWMGLARIGIGRVGHDYNTEEHLKVGEAVRYGPYTFGLFEIRLMAIEMDDEGNDVVELLVTRLS
jgi:hypothetical protein